MLVKWGELPKRKPQVDVRVFKPILVSAVSLSNLKYPFIVLRLVRLLKLVIGVFVTDNPPFEVVMFTIPPRPFRLVKAVESILITPVAVILLLNPAMLVSTGRSVKITAPNSVRLFNPMLVIKALCSTCSVSPICVRFDKADKLMMEV